MNAAAFSMAPSLSWGVILFVFLSVFPNHNVILADLFFLLSFVMLFVFLSEANITCDSVNSMRLHELSSKIRKILRHCDLKVFPITMLYYRGDVFFLNSIFLNVISYICFKIPGLVKPGIR